MKKLCFISILIFLSQAGFAKFLAGSDTSFYQNISDTTKKENNKEEDKVIEEIIKSPDTT